MCLWPVWSLAEGCSRVIKKHNPKVVIVSADPVSSIYLTFSLVHCHLSVKGRGWTCMTNNLLCAATLQLAAEPKPSQDRELSKVSGMQFHCIVHCAERFFARRGYDLVPGHLQ
jgi:hypothetical protein